MVSDKCWRSIIVISSLILVGIGARFARANDCEDATLITDTVTFNTFGTEGVDVTTCAANDTLDVWFAFDTCSSNDPLVDVEISVTGTNSQPSIALFDGCPDAGGQEIACRTYISVPFIVTEVSANQRYFVRIASDPSGEGITGTLTIRCPALFGACIWQDGLCYDHVAAILCGFDTEAQYLGDGAACPLAPCCLGDTTCVEVGSAECIAIGGVYQGDQSSCPTECDPYGACCIPLVGFTGCIEQQSPSACAAQFGVYLGDASICGDCGTLRPCCLSNGDCIYVHSPEECDSIDGIYRLGSCGYAGCDPFGACCLADQSCIEALHEADCTDADGVYQGDGSECTDVPACPPFGGACCMPPGNCEIKSAERCFIDYGMFQGVGTICENSGCERFGPCCLPEIGCVNDKFEAACLSEGGLFRLHEGLTCISATCPEAGSCCANGICRYLLEADCVAIYPNATFIGPGVSCGVVGACDIGACCLLDGSCESLTGAECANQGGAYQGIGSSCLDISCPIPQVPCCIAAGNCQELTIADCAAVNGVYMNIGLNCAEGEDCDQNGVPDACELEENDVNGDGILDACEPFVSDCNNNAIPDYLDIGGAGQIYWTGSGSIRRCSTDGGQITTLMVGANQTSIAIDRRGGKLYWTSKSSHHIRRADLNGHNVETLLQSADGVISPDGIAIDPVEKKFYWASAYADSVRRANLDGSGNELVFAPTDNINNPINVVIDAERRRFYVTQSNLKLTRADLNGNTITTYSGLLGIADIAIDPNKGIYYSLIDPTGAGFQNLFAMDLNGENRYEILRLTLFAYCSAIDLDIKNGKIYWSQFVFSNTSSRIMRSNLDGTDVEIVTPIPSNASSLVIVPASEDCNENQIPDECEETGEMNGDGTVDYSDIPQFVAEVLAGNGCDLADIDQNTVINARDIGAFVAKVLQP